MDFAIDYSSPIIFSALVTVFFAFFSLFRNYRFPLNSLLGILGIIASVWLFFVYSFEVKKNPDSLLFVLAFGSLVLYLILLVLHHLDTLKSRFTKALPDGFLYFPVWVGFSATGLVFLSSLSFSLSISFSSLLENFSGFTELAYWLAAVFACVLSLLSLALGVSTFFRLARQYGKKSGNLPEKTVGYFLGVSWSGLSFLNLIFSASMIGFINPEPEIILFLLTQITLLFLIAFAILAVIINRRYFLSWRVATAQFIASSIMLFNLASLLNSGSAEEVVLRSILLVVLAFLSHLLTQSVVNEITKKQKVQAATKDIYSANINLKRLDRAKSDFINTASHQLRSPLSVIKGISSLMMEGAYGKITSGVKEAVEKVFISNERLIGLIESLLNVSHLEEGRVDFEFRKIDLNKIAKVSAGGLILQAQNKKLFLNYVPYKKGELLVWVDEQKVIEAISNLVDNAVKYTQKGGVTVEAKKTVDMNRPAPERYRARVEVRDTGIGIKKEEQANLFKKFVRAGEGSKVNVVGTGLGLYVVRKMIEAHKGRIWAESAGEGRGSSFIIELPLNLPHPPEKEFVKRVVMEKDLSPKT